MNAPPIKAKGASRAPLRTDITTTTTAQNITPQKTALADAINDAYGRAYGASWAAVEAMKEAGVLLTKNECSQAWIRENCLFSVETATLYKRIAEPSNWAALEKARASNALPNASLRGAIAFLKSANQPALPAPAAAAPKTEKPIAKPAEVARLQERVDLLEQEVESAREAAPMLAELQAKVIAYETTDPDEQQAEILRLQEEMKLKNREIEQLKDARRRDAELARLNSRIGDLNNECNSMKGMLRWYKKKLKSLGWTEEQEVRAAA